MRLQEAPVFLGLDQRQLDLPGRNTKVQPRRHLLDVKSLFAVEQKLRDDLLDPRRARLRVGGNKDVIIAELEAVPNRGVEVVIMKLAGLPWERSCNLAPRDLRSAVVGTTRIGLNGQRRFHNPAVLTLLHRLWYPPNNPPKWAQA